MLCTLLIDFENFLQLLFLHFVRFQLVFKPVSSLLLYLPHEFPSPVNVILLLFPEKRPFGEGVVHAPPALVANLAFLRGLI